METKEKELNLPIGFLRSFQDEYFDRNGKQLLQSVFCIVLCSSVYSSGVTRGDPTFNYKWKLIRKLGVCC